MSKHRSRKVFFLSLLCLYCACTFQVYAQESCYEQYLREHDLKVLTAEDADDSYDELKKEVIARQRMHEEDLSMPIVLAIDTITGACQILAQDGTILADAYLAMVDSTWYMWLSVDPLVDKNISNTPYMYCSGNPVMLIDPDGEDSKMRVNDGVISIMATYYCSPKDLKSAQAATTFWNSQDNLKYTSSAGKEYKVSFSLNVVLSDHPQNAAMLAQDGKSNSYSIVDKIPSNEPPFVVVGMTKNNKICLVVESNSQKLTGAHEVAHTMMYLGEEAEHSAVGIMTAIGSDPMRSGYVDQATVDKIVESNINNQSLWDQIVNFFGW